MSVIFYFARVVVPFPALSRRVHGFTLTIPHLWDEIYYRENVAFLVNDSDDNFSWRKQSFHVQVEGRLFI